MTVNAVLQVKGDKVEVLVKSIKTKPSTLSLPIVATPKKNGKAKRSRAKSGKPIHDIILESAKAISRKANEGIFTSVDLFKAASKKYPELKKNSFNTTVISAAPEHTSWKHYKHGKDYLEYLGKGKYRLREKAEAKNQ